jgi:type II secretory pathway component GspD/PulD (secretin)
VLELLKTRTDTKIISDPRITTMDNQEAKINVSTVFNIPTYERNDTTGQMEVTGYTEKDLGIILTVTPHVNQAGDIVVDLRPEVSTFIQFDTFGTGTNAIYAPRFSTRTAQTQVMIKDNQTIAIGGLMKETKTKYYSKVPLLGDIPLLGELFKKTEDGTEATDLLIFVTVRLIKDDEDDMGEMKKAEKRAVYGERDKVSF